MPSATEVCWECSWALTIGARRARLLVCTGLGTMPGILGMLGASTDPDMLDLGDKDVPDCPTDNAETALQHCWLGLWVCLSLRQTHLPS